MKREFLKNLGIEDAETINAILNENSTDIGRAKGELDTYIKKVEDLEKDIKSKDGEIATLKDKAKDVDTLNEKISQLEADKTDLTTKLNTEVSQIQKTHAIENSVAEQLETLKQGEDTSFLFGDAQTTPSGTHISNPPNGGGTPPTSITFAEAVAKAINKN